MPHKFPTCVCEMVHFPCLKKSQKSTQIQTVEAQGSRVEMTVVLWLPMVLRKNVKGGAKKGKNVKFSVKFL